MTDYDLEADAQETAWATSLGFNSASDYHQASDEAFQARVDELCLFEGNGGDDEVAGYSRSDLLFGGNWS